MSDQSRPPRIPDRAWIVALMSLPHIGPRRIEQLRAQISAGGPPARDADNPDWWAPLLWTAILGGSIEAEVSAEQRDQIHRSAVVMDVGLLWQRHVDAGIRVSTPADSDYPALLRDDPEPPAALFVRGDLSAARQPAVAVVGTRDCTPYGHTIAIEIGSQLAAAGVAVVSGLAMGIDAAAHSGAVQAGGAPPVAVIAAGFERPTPQSNIGLFRRVVDRGVVVSETPLDAAIARWRFPARNRIIAALADAVIVVESGVTGGSLYTVDEALRRDRPVFAVPGSIHNPASAGTNRLLRDGAFPFLEIDEVLDTVGASAAALVPTQRPSLSADATLLLEHVGYEPGPVDEAIAGSGLAVGRAIAALDELLRLGFIVRSGAVVQRLDPG